EETNHFWIKWIENNPERRSIIQKAREIISLVDYKSRFALSDQAYMDMYENIVQKSHQQPKGKNFQWGNWHKTAAILFLVFSTIYGINFIGDKKDNQAPISIESSWLTVNNPAGQKYKFQLPDGTR